MKRLFILGGLILVILLGGGGAYFLVTSGEEAAEEAIEEEPEEDHAEEGGHGASPPELQFVEMEILALPVVRRKALSHYPSRGGESAIARRAGEEADPGRVGARARRHHPRILPHAADRRPNVDLAVLKARLKAAATQVLGAGVVEEVLLVNVIRGRR